MTTGLITPSATDSRFEHLNPFELTVPKGYNHSTQLTTFAQFMEDKSEGFHPHSASITDVNFAGATQRLVPGKTYKVKMFRVKQGYWLSSPDFLAFLATQKAILVGAQGVSLIRQLRKDKFPSGVHTLSFDEKDALWKTRLGHHMVPYMYRYSAVNWYFGLSEFEGIFIGGHCFICFCDLSA